MKRLLILVAVLASFTYLCKAQQSNAALGEIVEMFNRGQKYYSAKDYVNASKYYERLVELVYQYKEYEIGGALFLEIGCNYTGVKSLGDFVDFQKAFHYFKLATDLNYIPAYVQLGLSYYCGFGCSRNEEIAFRLFEKGAIAGDVSAQNALGMFYRNKQDYAKAYEWFLKSAQQGDVGSQNDLGVCYLFGYGVAKNERTAFYWFQKAAEGGEVSAMKTMGGYYERGVDPVKQNKAEALKWYRKAAQQGDTKAQIKVNQLENN